MRELDWGKGGQLGWGARLYFPDGGKREITPTTAVLLLILVGINIACNTGSPRNTPCMLEIFYLQPWQEKQTDGDCSLWAKLKSTCVTVNHHQTCEGHTCKRNTATRDTLIIAHKIIWSVQTLQPGVKTGPSCYWLLYLPEMFKVCCSFSWSSHQF